MKPKQSDPYRAIRAALILLFGLGCAIASCNLLLMVLLKATEQ